MSSYLNGTGHTGGQNHKMEGAWRTLSLEKLKQILED